MLHRGERDTRDRKVLTGVPRLRRRRRRVRVILPKLQYGADIPPYRVKRAHTDAAPYWSGEPGVAQHLLMIDW